MKKIIQKTKNKKGQVINPEFNFSKKFGDRASDSIAKWAGSWTFILIFSATLILWMIMNTLWITNGSEWDPYPFILLNLLLSSLAAFQAPIILMSQNRSGEKDRIRANYDYAVNRKAEREIKELKKMISKIDRKLSK